MSRSEPGLAVIGQRVLGVVDLDGLVQGKERHAVHSHHDDSMISAARLDESAPLRAASIISSPDARWHG